MKVVIAADHGGYEYKTILVNHIQENGYELTDLGTFTQQASDYPDHATSVAKAIQNKNAEKGILICGSGVGVSVAANKFKGVRAGVCHDVYSAHQCVEHDDVNVLCLGERVIGIALAKEIVTAFLEATFSYHERHQRRLNKILAIEENNMQ
jgi:ribose 5-phosphate isomerase B